MRSWLSCILFDGQMSQEQKTMHTFASGRSAGHLEVRLAKTIHTFALGCSAGPFKIHLAGPTLSKVRIGAQVASNLQVSE